MNITNKNKSDLFALGQAVATAEASFDFSVQGVAELVIKVTKPDNKLITYEAFTDTMDPVLRGYDNAPINGDSAFSDGARRLKSRVKALMLADYGIKVGAPVKSENAESKAKAARRAKDAEKMNALADQVQEYALANGLDLMPAAFELAGRSQDPSKGKALVNAASKRDKEIAALEKADRAKFKRAIEAWLKTATLEELRKVYDTIK